MINTKTKLTFCIPFYSGQDYLKEVVRSVLSQTATDWALIIIDDCGPDGTWAKAFVHELNDPRIQYRRNEVNLGLAGNWNHCLEAAGSDLVNILHADDRLKSNYAQEMIAAADQYPDATVLFCNASIIDENGDPKFSFADWFKRFLRPSNSCSFSLSGPDGILQLVHGDFVMCPTMTYRKSKLGTFRFDTRWRMVIDLDFKFRLLLAGHSLIGIPNILYEYRRHSKNQTSAMTKNLMRFQEEVYLLDEIAETASQSGWKKIAKAASSKRIVKLNLCYCIVTDLIRLQVSDAVRKSSFLFKMLGTHS